MLFWYLLLGNVPDKWLRENHPGSPEEYYRRSLAIPFLDYIMPEIENRFGRHTILAMKYLCIIPSYFSD